MANKHYYFWRYTCITKRKQSWYSRCKNSSLPMKFIRSSYLWCSWSQQRWDSWKPAQINILILRYFLLWKMVKIHGNKKSSIWKKTHRSRCNVKICDQGHFQSPNTSASKLWGLCQDLITNFMNINKNKRKINNYMGLKSYILFVYVYLQIQWMWCLGYNSVNYWNPREQCANFRT